MSAFTVAFDRVIGSEGGYTNNPKDPGNWTSGKCGSGRLLGTKYGISASSYPNLDIINITLNQAQEIYKRDYWDKLKLDYLSAVLSYQLFDASVQHGYVRATRILQHTLGITEDGLFGKQTLSEALKQNQKDLAMQFCINRIYFYTSLKDFNSFGKGWMNRMARNLEYLNQEE
jgi:lysozyme family protein